MTKQNKNKSGYKKTETGWIWVKLKDVLCYERPDKYIVKSTEYTDKGLVPVLTANKSFILGYTNEDYGIYRKYPAIIFDDFTTESKYVDFPFKVKSSAIKILRPKDNSVDLKFIYERMQLIEFPLGGHKRYYISEYQYNKIPLPPLPEQQKIARILSTWDKAIELVEKLIAAKRRLKKGLMQQLLTGKMRFREFKDEEWMEVRVKDVCVTGRGRVISQKEIEANPGPYPVYSSQTENYGILGYMKTHDFDGEYATWTTDGVHAGRVFYRTGKFNCTNVCGTLKKKNNDICLEFLAYKLNTVTKKYVSYVGNHKLMNNVMASIKVDIPKNVKEQQKIAAILSSLDKDITSLQNIDNILRDQKKGLMQKLLTGKIRVKING